MNIPNRASRHHARRSSLLAASEAAGCVWAKAIPASAAVHNTRALQQKQFLYLCIRILQKCGASSQLAASRLISTLVLGGRQEPRRVSARHAGVRAPRVSTHNLANDAAVNIGEPEVASSKA